VHAPRSSRAGHSVTVTAPGADLIADSKVIASLGEDSSSADRCGTVLPVIVGDGTTLFCAFGQGPDGHTNPAPVRWVLEFEPMETDLADKGEWRLSKYIRQIGVPAGSTVYPAVVRSSSSGETLLIEWSAVVPGSHVQGVRRGELSYRGSNWTFTPLPAPAIFATSDPPAVAW